MIFYILVIQFNFNFQNGPKLKNPKLHYLLNILHETVLAGLGRVKTRPKIWLAVPMFLETWTG